MCPIWTLRGLRSHDKKTRPQNQCLGKHSFFEDCNVFLSCFWNSRISTRKFCGKTQYQFYCFECLLNKLHQDKLHQVLKIWTQEIEIFVTRSIKSMSTLIALLAVFRLSDFQQKEQNQIFCNRRKISLNIETVKSQGPFFQKL